MHAPRVLVTTGSDTTRDTSQGPRRDYAQVAGLLGADILDQRAVRRSVVARALDATLGLAVAQAWLAFRASRRYDVVLTDGEHVGIPLGILLRLARRRPAHITIGHRLTARKKRPFFRLLRADRGIDRIVVHSRAQYDLAQASLGIERRRLALVPYQVDTSFWHPRPASEERLVVSAGLEFRDYDTLARATMGLDATVVIAASSNWSRHRSAPGLARGSLRVGTFDYPALRDLYARAALVVVPLVDVDNQAGVTTILEAMAMGKPVVVSQSRGQTDVVEDRRSTARRGERPRPVSLARTLGEQDGLAVEPTGFYVVPGDAEGLRRAIEYLLAHPGERARLGAAGRRLVERVFTLEQFGERMRSLVIDASAPAMAVPAVRRPSFG